MVTNHSQVEIQECKVSFNTNRKKDEQLHGHFNKHVKISVDKDLRSLELSYIAATLTDVPTLDNRTQLYSLI